MTRRLLVAAAVAALAVAGCGSSSTSSTPSTSATTPSTPPATASTPAAAPATSSASTVAIAANPSGMLMFNTDSLTAKAGKVTIEFTNHAPLGHNFTLASPSGAVLGATPTFSGGTKSFTVTLKAGKYTYYCSVPGHRAAGMQGTLTV